MIPDVVILGAGGHARVLLDTLRLNGARITGCIAPDAPDGRWPADVPWLGDDDALATLDAANTRLVCGVGASGDTTQRKNLFSAAKKRGYTFINVIHVNAVIAADVTLGEGVQIMAGVVVQSGSVLGDNTVINTRASADHDCRIDAHAFVAPGVTLCGDVHVGDGAFIGAGAMIIPGVTVGAGALVAAGAAVISDVRSGDSVGGTPAASLSDRRI